MFMNKIIENMKKIVISSAAALLLFMAAGCNKENISYNKGEKADISLSLKADGEFVEVGPMSKSEETADVNEFSVAVIDVASGRTVNSWDRFADVPEVISLTPADYRIEAKSPGNLPVAWGQPIFEGSQQITVRQGETQNVSIVCTISNMKVSVRCTDTFLEEVEPDFTVTVSTTDGPLVFTQDKIAAGESGYFKVAPLTFDLYAVRKTGGVVTHHMEISEVAPKDHHVFTLDAGSTGYADISEGISIDYSCNEREEYILIDGLDENPVDPDEPENPGTEGNIVISATAGVDAPVTYSKAALPSEFNLTVSAPAGIESYLVNVKSSGLRGLLDMMQMDYSVDLAAMDGAEEGFWGALFGITSADVKGKTDVTFEIAAFLSAMPLETNEMEIVITDNAGASKSAVLSITMTE